MVERTATANAFGAAVQSNEYGHFEVHQKVGNSQGHIEHHYAMPEVGLAHFGPELCCSCSYRIQDPGLLQGVSCLSCKLHGCHPVWAERTNIEYQSGCYMLKSFDLVIAVCLQLSIRSCRGKLDSCG